MLRWFPAAILTWLIATGPGFSGPWLRDPSLSFASFQVTPRNDGSAELGIYAERGATDWLTLGVDLNNNAEAGHALIFARLPIRRDSWVAALDVAVGGHRYLSDTGSMARVLLGVGSNVEIAGMTGWAAISIGPEWRQENGRAAWKGDAVLGFKADRQINPILGVETYLAPNDDFYWSAIPGVTVKGGPGRTWLFGLERRGGPSIDTLGIRTGLWFDF